MRTSLVSLTSRSIVKILQLYGMCMSAYRLDEDGFETIRDVLREEDCVNLIACLENINVQGAGTRSLLRHDWCTSLISQVREHPRVKEIVPANYVAAQCTYFEKSAAKNWLVSIHQDLSIQVESRLDHPALRGWSEKEGELFVQPPEDVLAQLVAIRVHLDACSEDDGPLQFIPRTHVLGRVTAHAASALRKSGPFVSCLQAPGDVLAMRPLALHASSKATGASKRRVLHIVFGPPQLPFGLQWPDAAVKASAQIK